MTSIVVLQSASSEILGGNAQSTLRPKAIQKRMCAESLTFGIKACSELQSRNATFIKDCPLYSMIGEHSFLVEISPGKSTDDVVVSLYQPSRSGFRRLVAYRHMGLS